VVAVPVELTDGRAVLPVHDASPAVIESEAGVIQTYAREDDSLPTGTVSMSHAWGALIGDDPAASSPTGPSQVDSI
jgi:hypothetical protein